jgi:hypothetical protein
MSNTKYSYQGQSYRRTFTEGSSFSSELSSPGTPRVFHQNDDLDEELYGEDALRERCGMSEGCLEQVRLKLSRSNLSEPTLFGDDDTYDSLSGQCATKLENTTLSYSSASNTTLSSFTLIGSRSPTHTFLHTSSSIPSDRQPVSAFGKLSSVSHNILSALSSFASLHIILTPSALSSSGNSHLLLQPRPQPNISILSFTDNPAQHHGIHSESCSD